MLWRIPWLESLWVGSSAGGILLVPALGKYRNNLLPIYYQFMDTLKLAVIILNFNYRDLIRVVRKPAFCICENKDADQLRGNREADQRLCFRYIDSMIPLLSKSEISSL